MNYRHVFHAGNFADVFKHILLARMIAYMKRKEKAFRVYDTHAGIGTYNLSSDEAQQTGEFLQGAQLVMDADIPKPVANLIAPWMEAVREEPEGYYPGSPRLIRSLLRKQDRLSAYELHNEDFVTLQALFQGDYQARITHLDGWLVSGAHIPPKEGRGLMLVDPPFEKGDDFDQMIRVLENGRKRWAGGTIALWYPVKKRAHTDEWLGTLRELKFPDLIDVQLTIREPSAAGQLNGCGMVIANAPFVLHDELNIILPWLSKTLAQGRGADYRIQNLSAR